MKGQNDVICGNGKRKTAPLSCYSSISLNTGEANISIPFLFHRYRFRKGR